MKFEKKQFTKKLADELRINLAVQPVKLSPEPVCDFCGDATPVCCYASRRMSTGEARHCWRWLACATCEQRVDRNEWPALQRRIAIRVTKMLPTLPRKLVSQAVDIAFDEFLEYAIREVL